MNGRVDQNWKVICRPGNEKRWQSRTKRCSSHVKVVRKTYIMQERRDEEDSRKERDAQSLEDTRRGGKSFVGAEKAVTKKQGAT